MTFANPRDNVLQLGLKDGMRVGDLGAGVGHYTFAASPIVGPDGHVYAIDIQEDVLTHLANDARQRRLLNVDTVWGDIEKSGGTKLRDHTLDAVILSNVLFQLERTGEALAEIRRVVKPGGRVLVVDWAGSYDGIGPAPEQIVSERDAEELFIGNGFHKLKSFRGGPHHYSIVFTSP